MTRVRVKWAASLFAISLAVLSIGLAAENSLAVFAGTWKEDLSQTVDSSTANVISFSRTPDGNVKVIQADAKELAYPLDGQPHPDPGIAGATVTWKSQDDSTLANVTTKGGELHHETTRSVSADGKNLTSITRTRMPDGNIVTNTTVRERTSAEKSGVWGSWKLVSFRTDTPSVMVVTVPDGQTIDLSQQVPTPLKFRAKLGGNDYPVAVSQMSSGMTVSISGVRDRTLDRVVKRDGKPIQFFTWTVSRDGRTLTEEDREPGSDKVILKQVFQRQ